MLEHLYEHAYDPPSHHEHHGNHEYPRALPRIKVGTTIYFVDARLRQLRNGHDPADFIGYGDDYACVVHDLTEKVAHGA
jgi:hypothetical protein